MRKIPGTDLDVRVLTVALLFLCFLKLSKSTITNPVNIDINDNLVKSHLGEANSFV